MRVILELAGPLEVGMRLRLAQVRRACKVLRDRHGVVRPLLDVRLRRVGASIVAELQSVHVEPTSGQLLIPEVVVEVNRYAREHAEERLSSPMDRPQLNPPVAVIVA
jgi:hypothetical protein